MNLVYVAIGSNLGDRERNIFESIRRMKMIEGVKVESISNIYESEPAEYFHQPDYLNCVVSANTNLEPENFLEKLLMIENEMGRVRICNFDDEEEKAKRYSPRIIDNDIILYGDFVINSMKLKVPHPKMTEREFVLRPLLEISNDLIHPVNKKTIPQLLDELMKKQKFTKCRIFKPSKTGG